MHKIHNITGSARHGWDRMPTMGFGSMMSRSQGDLTSTNPRKTPNAPPVSPAVSPGTPVTLSFNVPFNSNLAGPEPDDIIYSSPGAFRRWTHPEGTPEDTPNHRLPVHIENIDALRSLCKEIADSSDGRIQATVLSSEPKPLPGFQRGPLRTSITNVCISAEVELAQSIRGRIMTQTPISLQCSTIDIDFDMIMDYETNDLKDSIRSHVDGVANALKADIFLLHPKQLDEAASFNGSIIDTKLDNRLRCHIYGDYETAEHAKTRILILLDQILHRSVDMMRLELSMHPLISGRAKKNIKLIESATNTAIYFPPPFPHVYGYTPIDSQRRPNDQIIITSEDSTAILKAKKMLHDLTVQQKVYSKGVLVTPSKLDSLILERMDKIKKIMETNGSCVILPPLGDHRNHPGATLRVQGTDVLNVERTVRDVMALAGQFYSATWFITQPDPNQRPPTPSDVRAMLSDICINSGAEICFEKVNFHIFGSDDAVKAAMMVISNIPFVRKSQYSMSVKLELANEHKEFVSGKKNGKINKIMSHSSVQIVFDGWNEYNFYIVVRGSLYEATKSGLELVEQEMPAAISFHVPDQYHKRIIGIGGQHIQRIMKKYSVFVKFSNAMDRGGLGKEDDDIKVDNVICRTPARNAQNLDLVKQEIMDMVEKSDAEFVSEHVVVNRLYHRELIARMREIEELEKKWNCKITFPSTEQASDMITISGPEYQVPQAVDEFLGMVPESHDIAFAANQDLKSFLRSDEFEKDVKNMLKDQYVVEVQLGPRRDGSSSDEKDQETLTLCYTRNNAGGLKDAIDFLITKLVTHGLDAETIKGAIPRPKSDSFEQSLPFFESKLLQKTNSSLDLTATDSPTRVNFADDVGERSGFLDKLRKPGSIGSFSSMLERRKNGSNSPGSLFKHASSNASKASLISIESQGSGYRNPWNDSGINLPDEDPAHPSHAWATPTSVRYESKFPFGASTSGELTPRYDPRASVDSGRPSTSHSASGYPGPIGPPR
ncbi:KH domain-containing protein [Pseudovirgaria hyperparasitica]|uniref:KH domain-containing protein n=1 Tax=Pseudovirgaria hyperparasitica TaxID=470096 RepID=A0A6A6WCS4_9PEZI|nr:KH domain-containing protein [Pseudovirgaria hyperparasitica]KAF2760628.1 KH domain-containing protein [Pseudovirgaria hyperparasitica]